MDKFSLFHQPLWLEQLHHGRGSVWPESTSLESLNLFPPSKENKWIVSIYCCGVSTSRDGLLPIVGKLHGPPSCAIRSCGIADADVGPSAANVCLVRRAVEKGAEYLFLSLTTSGAVSYILSPGAPTCAKSAGWGRVVKKLVLAGHDHCTFLRFSSQVARAAKTSHAVACTVVVVNRCQVTRRRSKSKSKEKTKP
jgi:hypothetical protein